MGCPHGVSPCDCQGARESLQRRPGSPFVAGAAAPTTFHRPYEATTGPSRTKEPRVQLDVGYRDWLNGGKPAGDGHELATCGSVRGATDPSGRRLPQAHQPTRPPQAEHQRTTTEQSPRHRLHRTRRLQDRQRTGGQKTAHPRRPDIRRIPPDETASTRAPCSPVVSLVSSSLPLELRPPWSWGRVYSSS